MIREIKLKKTRKIKKNGKRKNNKKNKVSKHIVKGSASSSIHKMNNSDKKPLNKLQEGGNNIIDTNNNNNTKEKFEVRRLTDIDYSQFSLSKYLSADTDWGSSPGPPPKDCCIL